MFARSTAVASGAVGDPAEQPDVALARQTIDIEIDGLRALAQGLDHSFSAATRLLAATKGRVIVAGMGKSGHVGAKLASTLASVGTAAFFIHPGEASHGDLGMITREDAVIAISNSGETTELADIIAFCQRFSITLIGLTSRAQSTLARTANVALILPRFTEACPLGLAPTTSTTMMMALGDALAMALLTRKNFSARDFKLIHPGGTLGNRLLKAADLMHGTESLPICSPETLMSEALVIMTSRSFGCVGIVDAQERLIGIITDGDLRRHMGTDLMERPAQVVMTTKPIAITADVLVGDALSQMNENKVTGLFIVDDNRPIGFLHVHDLIRAGVV